MVAQRELVGSTVESPGSLFAGSSAGENLSPTPNQNLPRGDFRLQEFSEFSYQPVPILVPVSFGFLLMSIVAFIYEVLVIVPLVGAMVAVLAIRSIRKAKGDLGGMKLASLSLGLLITVFVTATSLHTYSYLTEVPEGFRRVSFASEISAKGIEVIDGVEQVPEEVKALDGEKLFLKGFMYPTKQMAGITSFVLCKDSGDCCFGGQPKLTDMILVTTSQPVNFYSGMIAVAGKFSSNNRLDAAGLNPVYRLDSTYFSSAKTSY